MSLKPEEQKQLIKMYIEGNTIQEIAKETGRAWQTVEKYVGAAKAEMEARPIKNLAIETVEVARTRALDEIQKPIDYLLAVLEHPHNQLIGIKAADVLSRVINVKARITGEKAPVLINKKELRATVDLTQEFRNFMDGD
jgi:predicted transcriptional regulator